jgi:hypothetical protein
MTPQLCADYQLQMRENTVFELDLESGISVQKLAQRTILPA